MLELSFLHLLSEIYFRGKGSKAELCIHTSDHNVEIIMYTSQISIQMQAAVTSWDDEGRDEFYDGIKTFIFKHCWSLDKYCLDNENCC